MSNICPTYVTYVKKYLCRRGTRAAGCGLVRLDAGTRRLVRLDAGTRRVRRRRRLPRCPRCTRAPELDVLVRLAVALAVLISISIGGLVGVGVLVGVFVDRFSLSLLAVLAVGLLALAVVIVIGGFFQAVPMLGDRHIVVTLGKS